jgi:hypothetical protein
MAAVDLRSSAVLKGTLAGLTLRALRLLRSYEPVPGSPAAVFLARSATLDPRRGALPATSPLTWWNYLSLTTGVGVDTQTLLHRSVAIRPLPARFFHFR